MKVDYSIVVPVYYNETTLRYTESQVREKVFAKTPWKGELIFVDDGSKDGSFAVLEELQKAHPEDIRVFKLSRNFGQGRAVRCGMEHADNAVIAISADGQDPVEIIPQMLEKHFNEGRELAIAYRASRDETIWRRTTSWMVYSFVRWLGNKDIPVGGFDFYLLGNRARREFVKSFNPHTFGQINIMNLGFSRAWIPYHRENRKGGKSTWTFAKKFTYMIDGVLGHSYLPIRAMSVIGALFAGASFLLGLYFLFSYIIHGGHAIKGWTPIVLLILFSAGSQMIMIGVLGEYLWRVLAQVRQEPTYIIEKELDDTQR